MHVRGLHRIGRSQRTGPRPRRGWLLALAAFALVALVASGCGSNNNSGGSNSGGGGGGGGGGGYGGGGGAPTTGAATAATVSTSNTKLGQILVDASGRTLYLFQKDQPNQSACSGGCAAAWPVDQSAGTPKASNGVKASMLGTIKRGDGTTQVTYNKHPLYFYSGDSGPGQQAGQGLNAFGAKWYVVAPAGGAVT
jgi:predicted lipoprotein with Yx(FWY)xxD motif